MSSKKILNIINPATEVVIDQLAQDTKESINKKFNRAEKFQTEWQNIPFASKVEMIKIFSSKLISNKQRLAKILTSEMGKPITQSLNEINGTCDRINFFIENTEKELAPKIIREDERITFEPLGIIGNISAWNYPYFVGSNVFIPALLTGNCVLYKPSEHSLLTGIEITKLLYESGIPKQVFALVIGDGSVGERLLHQPLNGIFFTGSYPIGVQVAQLASRKLMKTGLELGGKDGVYICDDVDIKKTAHQVADGAFYNAGQSCCAVERIYVHQSIYITFVKEFIEAVKGFVIGDPQDSNTYLGPLVRKSQISVLQSQVKDALKKKAHLLLGGRPIKRKGFYFEPTVFSHVNHQMKLMTQESFGPIIGIQKVKDDREAIRLLNDSVYGLTGGVYSVDKKRAEEILKNLQVGTVYWNCCDRVVPRLPWSGRKYSGLGSTLSYIGIQTFLQPKAWHKI